MVLCQWKSKSATNFNGNKTAPLEVNVRLIILCPDGFVTLTDFSCLTELTAEFVVFSVTV